jgi:low temperature requirement protein LtrA
MPEQSSKSSEGVVRVSTLELFFDLVFVFAITQVSHLFGEAHRALDLVRAVLVLAVVWWMYAGYAWLTSNVSTERFIVRVLLVCAMVAFLIIALRIPKVAEHHGVAFGLAYLAVVLIHTALFTHAPNSSARAILGILPFNLLLAIAVLASGIVSETWNWIPWAIAGGAILTTTWARREREFHLSPSHFVERHGLVVLIALGESVVAIGTVATDIPVGWWLVAWVVIGVALAAALWWTYFDGDDERAEHAMRHSSGADRARLAIQAYYYAHLAMIGGIIMAAAGVHEALGHLEQPEHASVWLISVGVAVYLLGAGAFRWLLHIGPAWQRFVAGALALGTMPVGEWSGSFPQLAFVVLVLAGMLVVEHRLVPVTSDVHGEVHSETVT